MRNTLASRTDSGKRREVCKADFGLDIAQAALLRSFLTAVAELLFLDSNAFLSLGTLFQKMPIAVFYFQDIFLI